MRDVPFNEMEIPLIHLKSMGVDFLQSTNSIYVCPETISREGIQPFELACGTHPGVISDMQPLFVVAALAGNGNSVIRDYRYPDRTRYVEELAKLCPGFLSWEHGKIRAKGPAPLTGARVQSTDLRGSMAVVLGGLIAEGTTVVENVDLALRGYNKFDRKLTELGIEFTLSESETGAPSAALETPG